MEALRKGIEQHMEHNALAEPTTNEVFYPEMEKLAQDWALFSLKTYRGTLLTRALGISAAIVTFNTIEN